MPGSAVHAPPPTTAAPTRSAARLASPAVVLPVLVVLATAIRTVVSLPHDIPRYLPDEFLYPMLGRSLGAGQGVAVLGSPTAFPALFEPLLVAPFWAISSTTAEAIAATQLLHSLLVSLAAVPVYALARQLGLGERTALLCAALTLLAPAGFWASFLSADALGFLLALVTVALAVRTAAHPTRAGEVVTVAAVVLATFARVQYAVLGPAVVLALLASERWSPRRAARTYPIVAGCTALALVVLPLAGARLLGRYEAAQGYGVSIDAVRWVGFGAFLLVPAVGVAVAPGAVAWLSRALVRPADRSRAAFAVLVVALLGTTLVLASVITVETVSDRFMERYLMVAAPLVLVAFACWLDERRPARVVAIATALVVLVVSMRVTLASFTQVQGIADSAVLFAQGQLERDLGVGLASLVSALGIAAGLAVAVLLVLRPRTRGAFAWAFVAAVFGLVAVGSVAGDRAIGTIVWAKTARAEPDWVDRGARGAEVTLVQTAGSSRVDGMVTAVLNRSVVRAVSLGPLAASSSFDGLRPDARVDASGRILVDGAPLRGAALVATGGAAVTAEDALATYDRSFVLLRASGAIRLSVLAEGVRSTGRLAQTGRIRLFPSPTGSCARLVLRLSVPRGFPTTVLALTSSEGTRRIRVADGRPTVLRWRSATGAPVDVRYRTIRLGDRKPIPLDDVVASASWATQPVDCAANA